MSTEETKQLSLVTKITNEASTIPEVLETEDQAFEATDLLLKVRKTFNDIEAKMLERTGPASETIKLIKEDFKKFLKPLEGMEAKLKAAIEVYANKVVAADTVRLQTLREETGDDTLAIQIGLKNLTSDFGDIKFRKKYSINIVDEKALPRKFWIKSIDMKTMEKLVADSDGTIKIPGVEISQVQSASIYVK